MKEDTIQRLSDAVEHVLHVQAMLESIAKHGVKAVKVWKAQLKNDPENGMVKLAAKTVGPQVARLAGKAKGVSKDLEKLFKAADEPGQYYDGREFRDRNQKLLKSGKAFEGDVGRVLAALRGSVGGMIAAQGEPDVKVTVRTMTEFIKRFTAFKIALNRV